MVKADEVKVKTACEVRKASGCEENRTREKQIKTELSLGKLTKSEAKMKLHKCT